MSAIETLAWVLVKANVLRATSGNGTVDPRSNKIASNGSLNMAMRGEGQPRMMNKLSAGILTILLGLQRDVPFQLLPVSSLPPTKKNLAAVILHTDPCIRASGQNIFQRLRYGL